MESEKSPSPSQSPIPTPIPIQIQSSPKPGTRSKTKTRNPKSKSKKSKAESPSATIIYVPVLVQSLPSDSSAASAASGKSRKAAQPVLNEQQMKDWRCQADDCTAEAAAVGRYYQRHRICPEHSKAPSVLFNGTQQRYCQQCSRYQPWILFKFVKLEMKDYISVLSSMVLAT